MAARKPQVQRRARQQVDTTDHQVGQDIASTLPSTGEARLEMESDIEIIDGPTFNNIKDELAFMEEPMEILVHESTDKNAEFVVQTYCNGQSQFFMRGKPQVVKRKFVGVLARAKHTSYSQEVVTDGNGDRVPRQIPHTALRYPFSVVNDRNPRGADWLRKTLAEA